MSATPEREQAEAWVGFATSCPCGGWRMIVVDPGHEYQLRNLDGEGYERLRFVKRVGEGYPGNKEPAHPGTTSQEVLRALIERGEYVNGQIPCAETEAATALMRSALLLLELRAARRHGRHLDIVRLGDLDTAYLCGQCGHAGCPATCRDALTAATALKPSNQEVVPAAPEVSPRKPAHPPKDASNHSGRAAPEVLPEETP